ncbi:hypothetical protein [Sphingomonas hankookensis]|uniref:hypothetical protein n=1 Tax=Sphingomonas hankookensis TaxID=563996 RepID=UPI003F793B95
MAALAVLAIVQNRVLGASAPWFIFTPAIVLLTLFFGTGPGVAATIAAAAFAGYVAASSSHPHLPSSTLWTASAAFCLSTLGLVWLVAALRRALQDLGRAARRPRTGPCRSGAAGGLSDERPCQLDRLYQGSRP